MASAPPQAHNLQPPPLSRDGKRWTRRRRGTRGLVVDLRAVPNVNHNDDNTRVHNVSKPDLLAVNALPRNLGSFKGANLPQKLTHPPADSTAQFPTPRDEPEQPPPSDTHTPDQTDVHSTLPEDKTNPKTNTAAPYVATAHPNAASARHRYASKNHGLATATQAADEPTPKVKAKARELLRNRNPCIAYGVSLLFGRPLLASMPSCLRICRIRLTEVPKMSASSLDEGSSPPGFWPPRWPFSPLKRAARLASLSLR